MSNTVYPELDCKQLIEDHLSVVNKEMNDRRIVNGENFLKNVCEKIARYKANKKTTFHIYFDDQFFRDYGCFCGDKADYIHYTVAMLTHNLMNNCNPQIVASLELSNLSVLVVNLG